MHSQVLRHIHLIIVMLSLFCFVHTEEQHLMRLPLEIETIFQAWIR